MNVNLRRCATAAIAILALSGCSPANKATQDAQGDLKAAQSAAFVGNTQLARSWVDRAIAADPNDINLYFADPANGPTPNLTISKIFSDVGDSPSLVLYMRKAAQQFPTEYAPLDSLVDNDLLMGDKVNLQKDATSLIKVLNAAILLPKNSSIVPQLTYLLAYDYCIAGNPTIGVQKFAQLIATTPSDPEPLNGLAYYYATANDKPHLQAALTDATKAVSLASALPKSDDNDVVIAECEDTLAWVQYRLGDYADAEQNSELAVGTLPTIPEIRYHLAMIYAALGKTDGAKVEINHALLLNPSYADAIAENSLLNDAAPAAKTAQAVSTGTTVPTP